MTHMRILYKKDLKVYFFVNISFLARKAKLALKTVFHGNPQVNIALYIFLV